METVPGDEEKIDSKEAAGVKGLEADLDEEGLRGVLDEDFEEAGAVVALGGAILC